MNIINKIIRQDFEAVNRIRDFKEKQRLFFEAWNYIVSNLDTLKKDQKKFDLIQKNLDKKYEQPLINAFEQLSDEEKRRFRFLYERRRETAQQEKDRINRIVKMFNGTIIQGG